MIYKRRKVQLALVVGTLFAATSGLYVTSTQAAVNCTTASTLSGSNFEIDTDANLAVDGASPCIDWLAGGSGTPLRAGVLAKSDKPSGGGDDSFGQGSAENDANPTIVTGSIPPNKSDLKKFGVFTESSSAGKFLELFWSRVQNPSGTTNMDFELNQKFCDPTASPPNCANNGRNVTPETPLRTAGDKLITYDLSKGGTVPVISIRTWDGSAWGAATVISGPGGTAIGSINTSAIPASATGGIGAQDPFTFGEAAISYSALFPPGGCGTFGSAYLKSRSSDSFTAELKDFVAPERVLITNCTSLTTTSPTPSVVIGNPISDTATLSGATSDAGGQITFHLFSDPTCGTEVTTGLTPVPVSGNGDYNSGNFTPSALGTYYWIASYNGDANNAPSSTKCGDPNESSIVGKAQSSIATAQTIFPQDSATLSAAAGGTPTGDVTFSLFAPTDTTCSGTPVFTQTVTLGSGAASTSNTTFSVSSATASTYRWLVSYPGDTTHDGSTSSCGTEHFDLTIANG